MKKMISTPSARRTVSLTEAYAFARRFGQKEDGTLTIFALFIFIMMILIGGIAVDLMKFESERVTLQNTLDRAVLAAADRDQQLSPKEVVLDYFDKAGLGNYISESDITVDQDELVSYRIVSATASKTITTHFMKMTGIYELDAPASGTAEERIRDLEISLVLDVSGSMRHTSADGTTTKLANLKTAAQEFIDQISSSSIDGTVSYSIIPYATQVNAGEMLAKYYNLTDEHAYSHCVDFEEEDFLTTELSTTELMQRTGHFDPWYEWSKPNNTNANNNRLLVCQTEASREIMPWEKNTTKLKNHINSFFADGNTSIDVGVKWGVALLDPGTQGVVADMIDAGEVDAAFENRPFEYDYNGGMKVLIVMTDGINTSQYYLKDDFINGYSDVYENDHDGYLSVYWPEKNKYWWEYDDDLHDLPYGDGAEIETIEYQKVLVCRENKKGKTKCRYQDKEVTVLTPVAGEAVRQTYPELWNDYSLEYVADKIYEPMTGSSSYADKFDPGARSYVSASTKDDRLDDICTAAKNKNIIIFTIGYEVTDHSKQVMKDCASTYNHFYDVQDLEIRDAFASIATQINNLKLTQ
ncbi:von Willebrand factor type A domain protein [Pseudoruegeria aquimaris]|uniref:von Willebrand factor type A domain protein n=1 Tax=Pseudoruegeria aquimaris TaxID=393663 RepID=A0A1Y5T802_9RHOB|nr:TadE/TadG family type IV pilus assembly protein [Pseudoruegeria aquimaris]SLN55875.1 von Willebrand factor type A domain protein [Pseudoruegeria aquimaris]